MFCQKKDMGDRWAESVRLVIHFGQFYSCMNDEISKTGTEKFMRLYN